MNGIEYKKLIYRRQFLLTAKDVEGLYDWKKLSICNGEKTLHVHPELEITRLEGKKRAITLLGYIFDWQNPEYGNLDILKMIFEHKGIMELIESTYEYSGRFALIYESEEGSIIFNDAGGQREIYYNVGECGVSCASQLPILSEHVGLEREPDERVHEFYNSEAFKWTKKQWLGKRTIYKDTTSLVPNHYLDINTGQEVRYWPLKPLARMSLEGVSERGARMLKGFINSAAKRNRLSIPVTAGWDSRLMLAASRDVKDDATYFVIRFPWMEEEEKDIRVPKELMESLGLKFKVMASTAEMDDEFHKIFMANTAYPREQNVDAIYTVLYKRLGDRMNLSSHISETVRNYKGTLKNPDGRLLSSYVGYDNRHTSEYVIEMCQKWLDENKELAESMNIDLMSLFYWEVGLKWEATHRTETDIAVDEFCPFSCRQLLSLLLSVNPIYRNKYSCPLYRRMMEKMWPEVLHEPINPSFSKTLKGILVSSDFLYPIKRLVEKLERRGRL